MLLTRRCNLAGVMLQLMALGIPDVTNFDFMSKPSPGKMLSVRNPLRSSGKRCRVSCSSALCFPPEAIRSTVDHLELLGAVEKKDGQVFLTTLGKKMASFPLEPRYAKVNPAGSALIFFVHLVKDKVSAHKQTPLFAPRRRPSCCPRTTRVPRRF